MAISECYLFKNSAEFLPIAAIKNLPGRVRGIYVLYFELKTKQKSVVYIGMARGEKSGVKGRLMAHRANKTNLWTHFSVFEVWDNITKEQVEELEGLFRHIYRCDPSANKLNSQKTYKPLLAINRRSPSVWKK